MQVILVVGGPGGGKTTFAKYLSAVIPDNICFSVGSAIRPLVDEAKLSAADLKAKALQSIENLFSNENFIINNKRVKDMKVIIDGGKSDEEITATLGIIERYKSFVSASFVMENDEEYMSDLLFSGKPRKPDKVPWHAHARFLDQGNVLIARMRKWANNRKKVILSLAEAGRVFILERRYQKLSINAYSLIPSLFELQLQTKRSRAAHYNLKQFRFIEKNRPTYLPIMERVFNPEITSAVKSEMLDLLGTGELRLSEPTELNPKFLPWICNEHTNYLCCPSVDAESFFLFCSTTSSTTFLLDEHSRLYRLKVKPYDRIPAGTLLTGNLHGLQSSTSTVTFFVNDILALEGVPTWAEKTSRRLRILEEKLETVRIAPQELKTMQVEGKDKEIKFTLLKIPVIPLAKMNWKTVSDLPKWVPTKGFRFFSIDMWYNFGRDLLSFHWTQPSLRSFQMVDDDALNFGNIDIYSSASSFSALQIKSGNIVTCVPMSEMNESQSRSRSNRKSKKLKPTGAKKWCIKGICEDLRTLADRKDKVRMLQMVWNNRTEFTLEDLVDKIRALHNPSVNMQKDKWLKVKKKKMIQTYKEKHQPHPVCKLSKKDYLCKQIEVLLKKGCIEKNVDPATGLQVFNYTHKAAKNDLVTRCCRGLVMEPTDSKDQRIITTPFIRFFDSKLDAKDTEMCAGTLKLDGSLIIAFIWKGKLHTLTKRRMNSQQAQWANKWLTKNVKLSDFTQGYTYMFEACYQENRVVVNHCFEGLIFLSVRDSHGVELSREQLEKIGRTLKVPVVPCIVARTKDFQSFHTLSSEDETDEIVAFEGWVLKFANGNRKKLVRRKYKESLKNINFIHPLFIWCIMRYGPDFSAYTKFSMSKLPPHAKNAFKTVRNLMEDCFTCVKKRFVSRDVQVLEANMSVEDQLNVISPQEFIVCEVLRFLGHDGNQNKTIHDRGELAKYMKPNSLYSCATSIMNAFRHVLTNPSLHSLRNLMPSRGFEKTFCKAWEGMVPTIRELRRDYLDSRPVRLLMMLSDREMILVMKFVGVVNCVRLSTVCVKWCELIGLMNTPEELEEIAKDLKKMKIESYDSDDYYLNNRYRGYGSDDGGYDYF